MSTPSDKTSRTLFHIVKGLHQSALVVLREPAHKVVHPFSGGLRQGRRRAPQRVRSKNAAVHQHIFADREADTRLLLVADQRKVRIKKVVSSVAPSSRGMSDKVHQHVREAVTGHCAVGSAFHFEVQKYTAIATKNGDASHGALALVGTQGRYFFQAGPIFMLEHGARGILLNNAAND